MADLFDTLGAGPGGESSETPHPMEEPAAEENQVHVEATPKPEAEEVIEAAGEGAGSDGGCEDTDGDEPPGSDTSLTNANPTEKKPEATKQVNIVEEDPYEFGKCLITVAMALMPDDGSPDGRMVMLGIRNHQDAPILATCRLSDLMPLPDPVQQLLEQLKDQLPARSEKAAERKAKAEEAKKKLASKSKPAARTPPPAKVKKAEKPKPTSMNLFDMFDQTPK
jgi:hypothetical protein